MSKDVATQLTVPKSTNIDVFGDVDDIMSKKVVMQLYNFRDNSPFQMIPAQVMMNGIQKTAYIKEELPLDIRVVINSPGGSVLDMIAICDAMNLIQKTNKITTVGLGMVMSAAVPIIACGSLGHRWCGKNTRFMLHQMRGGMFGSKFDFENHMEQMKVLDKIYFDYLLQKTKIDQKYVDKISKADEEFYLSAQEALDLGIVDHIIT